MASIKDRIYLSAVGPLLATRQRREVLLALSAAYMLVQLSSLPVALSIPTLAEYFNTGIGDVTWIVIIYLLAIGSLVLLAARLGDRFGHSRVFFVGLLVSTAAPALISISQELWQLVAMRAVAGAGSALVMGNANAILANTFPPGERGRAFAIPIIGARFGTLVGLAVFGAFLHFLSWRILFISFVPLGLLATLASIPLLRATRGVRSPDVSNPIDWVGGVLLVATAAALILSGSHVHGGEESFTSSEGLGYHLPMQGLFLVLLVVFVLVEQRVRNPMIDIRHFRQRPFSLSLVTNVTYHGSMLGTMTLVPILVEEGFGMSPLYVTVVLLPSQALGLFMPLVAGWIFDKYHPKFMLLWAMLVIAGGFFVLGTAATHMSFWSIPLLMLPISIGTNMFNPINNATIMNSLPAEHRGVASGMLETTRELGHALGATAASAVLALAVPAGEERISSEIAQGYFLEGFQIASLAVVGALLFGATLAYFHGASSVQPKAAAASVGGDD